MVWANCTSWIRWRVNRYIGIKTNDGSLPKWLTADFWLFTKASLPIGNPLPGTFIFAPLRFGAPAFGSSSGSIPIKVPSLICCAILGTRIGLVSFP